MSFNVKQHAENMREDIRAAAACLRSTERGRAVLIDVHRLLDGPISQLDDKGWSAVQTLIACYRFGFQGSVLESIEPASAKGGGK